MAEKTGDAGNACSVYRGYKLEIHHEDGAWLVGIAGTGWWSRRHIEIENALDEARLWIDVNLPKIR